MGIKTMTVVRDGAGAITSQTESETSTLMETVFGYAKVPLGILADENEYITKKDAGIAATGLGFASFFAGEIVGHRREKQGKDAFIPIFAG